MQKLDKKRIEKFMYFTENKNLCNSSNFCPLPISIKTCLRLIVCFLGGRENYFLLLRMIFLLLLDVNKACIDIGNGQKFELYVCSTLPAQSRKNGSATHSKGNDISDAGDGYGNMGCRVFKGGVQN
jgi:hypothetical protein